MKKLILPFAKILGFYILVGFILRVILFFLPITDRSFSLIDYVKPFMIGVVNDFCISIIAFIFFWLYLVFLSDSKYKYPFGYIILSILVGILIYLFFFRTIFDDYGSVIPIIVQSFVAIKAISFALLLFLPKIRKKWRYCMYCFTFFLYVFLIIFNAISEFLFWSEFGVRYNFIAVDYLIYTNEIIGNIMESYPIIPVFSILTLVSLIITALFVRTSENYFTKLPSFKTKLITSILYIGMTVGAIFLLKFNEKQENSDNEFANELQANGLFRFYKAYLNSSLNYNKFHAKLPIEEAFAIVNKAYNLSPQEKNTKIIRDSLPEIRKNVVLITIESMSSDFMNHFGNTENLTPNLDKLADVGNVFH